MSFLESIQHGLEKASQEASRITKIQHLHSVTTDLTLKTSQEGQTLITKAMDMYHQGVLAQGELTAICRQIATYQQQLTEVHEELQRLQSSANEAEQQIPLPPQPGQAYAAGVVPAYPAPPTGYPAYPAPASYPAYANVPPTGYPAYPAPAAYPAYPNVPSSSSGEPPTKPGRQTPEEEPPTQPLTFSGESPAQAEAQPVHHKPRQHHTPEAASAEPGTSAPIVAAAPVATDPSAPTAGTYANGILPPIFSPFAANPTTTPAENEAEKPAKAHHHTKKADEATPQESAAEK